MPNINHMGKYVHCDGLAKKTGTEIGLQIPVFPVSGDNPLQQSLCIEQSESANQHFPSEVSSIVLNNEQIVGMLL